MTNANQNVLELDNIKMYFPIKSPFLKRTVGYVKAVDDISLSIRRGETLVLLSLIHISIYVSQCPCLAGTGLKDQSGLLHCDGVPRQYADRQLVLGTAHLVTVFLGSDGCADADWVKGL